MIKRIVIGLTAVFFVMIATLAVHIYMVTRPAPGAISTITMGRIDFHDSLDSLQSHQILNQTRTLEGVKDVRMNRSDGFLICLYDRNKWSGEELTDWIVNEFTVSASFFRPSEELLAQSCPAIDKTSLTYQLGAFFQRIFESKH
ncbi:heavy-metal-associated domain-containing protein [Mongoliitalea daihaiensis]|nr:heavy-metal-associated domain-containing protein [Mongoliitalea daihaiensis]